MSNLNKEEMETIISFDESTGYAVVYTYNKKLINSLKKTCETRKDINILKQSNDGCVTFECPKSWIRVRPPKVMNISEEERKKRSERMRASVSAEE